MTDLMNSNMATTLSPAAPAVTPVTIPDPNAMPWPEVYTDPATICPQQRRETASPDIEP